MSETLTPWLQFLAQNGARIDSTGTPQIAGFGAADSALSGFVAPLTDLGLIVAAGDEAAGFLHNQLTNDVEHLDNAEARLAGYCSPKGRLLASFLMWRSGEQICLQLPRAIQPAVQKRLQMFVLRAKVKLQDASDTHVSLGLVGTAAARALAPWFPLLPSTPFAQVTSGSGTLIRVSDAGDRPRYQWITTPELAQKAWPTLIQAVPPAGPQAWRLAEIHAGIPQITQATQEQFVPQMINFELIGGVNFKKGCYPGQEIVARSQYLGKLKRRMLLATVDADATAGAEVFSSADPGQPCGMIVNAERNAAGGTDALVEIKIAVLDEGTVHLGSSTGPALQFQPLPYPLPDAA
jgi:tRNA-modifying protein YgfZ